LGLLLIVQGLAYAHLAGMPPVTGLYAAIIPTIIGALFGSCGQLNTGPVAMTAMLTLAAVSRHVDPSGSSYPALAAILAIEVGCCRLLLGLTRSSWIVNFLSQPALAGFTIAAAIIIGTAQLGDLFGVEVARNGHIVNDLWAIFSNLGHAHLSALVIGLVGLTALIGLKRFIPSVPPALLVCVAALAWSWWHGFDGPMIGTIPSGLPEFSLPRAPFETAIALIPDALWVTLIGFMEVLAVSRVASARTRQTTNLDQELIGQGLASIAAGMVGGFPVSGSVNRSTFNLHNGARTGLSSIIAALLVLAALLFIGPVLERLPRAVLGATVVASVIPLLALTPILRAWRAQPHDGVVALVTLGATLLLAPNMIDGILIGGGLAIALHLHRTRRPRMCELGRHDDGTLRDRERHQLPPIDPRIVTLRFDGRLYFVNAAFFDTTISKALSANPEARWILLAGDGINEIDATGVETLREGIRRLRDADIGLAFFDLKAQVQEALDRTGVSALLGSDLFFRTPEAALAELQKRMASSVDEKPA
jgi:sulfate permease, SulP family